jgi:hypothetical protein
MSESKIKLLDSLSTEYFLGNYWLKKDLIEFCKAHGIPTYGGKIVITKRIEKFLISGKIDLSEKVIPYIKTQKLNTSAMTLSTLITKDFRCTERHRVFFKSAIGPKFHFSVYIQNFFKQNIGKTYNDAIIAWYEEEKRKKDKSRRTTIAPQFEYNQFIRDFYNDKKNKGKKLNEAIEEWNKAKSNLGKHKYS